MDPRQRLDEINRGYQHAAVLLTAVHLGVFEAIGGGRATPAELALILQLDPRALETLLLALAAEELLTAEKNAFAIAPEFAPLLLEDSPQTLVHILNHAFHLMQRWARLDEVVRSGRPIPRDPGNPAELRAFICGMADISRGAIGEVLEKLDLGGCRSLLDLGGGPATAAIAFAKRHPGLNCIVFDLPDPIEIAREQIAAAGLTDRVAVQAGDYFKDELGEGFDLVYISNIIHSMGPEGVALLAAKSARALVPGGRIAVKDFYLEEDRIHPPHAALFSVNMLVGTEAGKSYTLGETQAILTKAGFGGFETIELAHDSKILIGRL